MTPQVASTCTICGAPVDTELLGGTCPRCLLGDVMVGGEETRGGEFDGHELLGEIARGGMGVVYRARQLEPERAVALKTLRGASLDSLEAMARFKHEAEVMVALDHAAILPVYHCGEQDGIPFFTMKLVEGGTLADRIAGYSGQWGEMAELMATVCDAVRHAHERGVLHRDLKPGNILFDSAGHAYVSDFGIAKLVESPNESLTVTRSLMGTPHYLAPEVAVGGAKVASVASDVWSLGVILYELLTGEKPFRGENLSQVLRALDAGQALAPRRVRADVPRDLEVIVLKALSREPGRRYATAQAMAEDLRAWLENRPIRARAVPTPERAWMWARRNPLLASTAVLLVVAVMGALAALIWGLMRVKQENARVIASQTKMRAHLREALLQQARAGRIAREMGWREAGLAALQEANSIRPDEDVRDEATAHLAGFDVVVGRSRHFARTVALSPSLDRYADMAGREIVIRDLADDRELWRFPNEGDSRTFHVEFDPANRWQFIQLGAALFLVAGDDHRRVAQWPSATLLGSTNDGEYALLQEPAQWRVVKCVDGMQVGAFPRPPGIVWSGALCPESGASLLACAQRTGIDVIDWRSGRVLHAIKPFEPFASLAWCGERLVMGLRGGQVQSFDLRRQRSAILSGAPTTAEKLYGIDDGSLLLTSSRSGDTRLRHAASGLELVGARGLTVHQIGADGCRFVTSYASHTIGEIQHPAALRLLPDQLISGGALLTGQKIDLSPDGRWLVINDARWLSVHEMGTGHMLATQEISRGRIAFFAPDGRTLWVVQEASILVLRLQRDGPHLKLVREREIGAPGGMQMNLTAISVDRSRLMVQSTAREVFEVMIPDGTGWQPMPSLKVPSFSCFSLSPDRRWVMGETARATVRPFDSSGQLKNLAVASAGMGSFSPDSQWVAFTENTHKWHVFRTQDWAKVHSAPEPTVVTETNILSDALRAAWSPDSRWFAVASDGTDIELVDSPAWRTVARLHGPLQLPVSDMRVAGDGASVVVMRRGGHVEIWNLPILAEELRARGIELHLPLPSPPPPTPPELAGPFEKVKMPPLKIEGAPAN